MKNMQKTHHDKVSDWLPENRPRERLLGLGADSLSDAELLSVLLGSGTARKNVLTLSQDLLKSAGGLRRLLNGSAAFLSAQHGMGQAKISVLISVREILKRYLREGMTGRSFVREPQAVLDFLMCELRDRPQECFKVLLLDQANQILGEKTLFEGTVNQTVIYPRDVIKYALDHFAAGMILVHNHPSGNCEPSRDDRELTRKMASLGGEMSIKVLDHLIIGENKYYSFRENGLL